MKSNNNLLKQFENEKFDIIVLAGQSNAQGHGMGPVEDPFVASDRIMYLCDNSNIHFEKNEAGEDYLFLPEECQKVFRMSYEEGKSVSEVAEILNISVHTVKSQRARAKKILQGKLQGLYSFVILFFLS